MKTISFTLFFILIIFNGCSTPNENDILLELHCHNLQEGIINTDSEIVGEEINKILSDLDPKNKPDDTIGHKENFEILISRINSKCENINAELLCYACIKTLPPQTEIILATDSSGVLIFRTIDISTPENGVLRFIRIHR